MKAYAMYTGFGEVNIPRGHVYAVGYYPAPKSYTVRCKGKEFVYSSKKTLLINWRFLVPILCTPDEIENYLDD